MMKVKFIVGENFSENNLQGLTLGDFENTVDIGNFWQR